MRYAWLIVAAGCLLSAPASADVLTYVAAWPESSPADWTHVLELPLFDPSYGILQSVDLQVHATFRGRWQYENTGGVPGLWIQQRTWSQLVTDVSTGTQLFYLEPDMWVSEGTVGAFDGVVDYAGTSGVTVDYLAPDEIEQIALGDIASFIGTGTRSFLVSNTSFFSIMVSPANYYFWSRSWSSSELTITYNYVPEPGAFALLGLGALGLRRRR